MIGIYKITNTINGKCYIGQSTNLAKRIKKHIDTLLNKTNRNEHLQNAYNQYGPGNFTIEIIEECNEEDLDEREIFWIDFYKAYDKNYGYNKTKGGKGGNGYFEVYGEEERRSVRKKKSESVSGEGNPNYGKHCYTNGVIIKYIKDNEIEQYEAQGWYKGVPDFIKEKERIANSGEKNGFSGKRHSEETKQKISESRTGSKNWNFGKMIYHKGNQEKYISPEDIIYYESLGWEKGRTKENKEKISKSRINTK